MRRGALLSLIALIVVAGGAGCRYRQGSAQADFVRDRVKTLPRRERADGAVYLRDLEGRATALGRGRRKASERRPAATHQQP